MRLAYTNRQGQCEVRWAAPWFMGIVCNGGGWAPVPRGLHVERKARQGWSEDAAAAHWDALAFGGLTTAEAWAVIRGGASHCGRGFELLPDERFPDRWFRNAWRHLPGGIHIDLAEAKIVQQERIVEAVLACNEHQKRSPRLWGHNGPQLIDVDFVWVRRHCEQAPDVDRLRDVWPRDLPRGR